MLGQQANQGKYAYFAFKHDTSKEPFCCCKPARVIEPESKLPSSVGPKRTEIVLVAVCAVQNSAIASSDAITQEERQELLWRNFFFHPTDWWDNRQNKRSPRHPDFRHKSCKDALWLDNRSKPQWVDSQLAIWDAVAGGPSALCQEARYDGYARVGTLSGQALEEQFREAVEALDLLVQGGSHISDSLFYRVLKRCILQKDLVLGRRVHALAVKSGYKSNAFLANHIILMYASHGSLKEATQVFSNVTAPNCHIWASIILANARHGRPHEAIKLYRQMRESSTKPDTHIFVAVLKACATAGDLASGKEVHTDVLRSGLQADVFVGNCLVDMYSKSGSLGDARRVFDRLPMRNVVTWTAMIAGYSQQGMGQEALTLYSRMEQEGTKANRVTFVCLLQACASVGALCKGKQLHTQIHERGLEADVAIGNGLVDMYVKCGSLEDARSVFDTLPKRNVVTWTAMIAGYVQEGFAQEGLDMYASMRHDITSPADQITFACLLRACASVGALHQGRQLHSEICRRGFLSDVVVGSCLVDMYAKCGRLEDARQVFDELPAKNIVTWTAIIAGYTQHGLAREALNIYASMQQEGMTPADHITFTCLLQACASIGALHEGRHLHAQIQQRGMEADVGVGSCLVDMYSKFGRLEDARSVFDRLPTRSVQTWNAIITGYVQHGFGQEALALHARMQHEEIIPVEHTFVSLLMACGSVGALLQGRQLHAQIQERGLESNLFIGSCLVDMYAKCGRLDDARKIFDRLHVKDVVTWNFLLNGHAEHSNVQNAILCFDEMRQQGVKPNDSTFSCLLVACSHGGLVDEGRWYFRSMKDHGISPSVYHYTCMIDLFGRSGRLDEAENALKKMAIEDSAVGWKSLLSACKSHGDMERGRRCFDQLITLDPQSASSYVLMASIYANAGRWRDAFRIESLRKSVGAWKKPANACIEVENEVHEFTVGERRADILWKLKQMNMSLKGAGGHVPHTEVVLKAVSNIEKEDTLCGHAEKLAMAYGLLNTPGGTTLLISKNLRMCNDCHSASKVLSILEKREIIVRDAHRVHHFLNGSCSCGDRH